MSAVNGDNSGRDRSAGHERNVSASTPVKNDRSAGRIDMSSNNISPIRDCRASPTGRPQTQQHRTPAPALQSPPGGGHRTSAVQQQPYVRPASGRSAMDLYAAIHESKKRLLGQQPAAVAVAAAVQTTPVQQQQQHHRTQPQATVTAVAAVRRSPERQSDRYRPRGDDRSAARYDFKRLLLQTNMAGGRRAQQSAVVRLQQPPPPTRAVHTPVPQLHSTASGHFRRTPSGSSFRKSNVLASTIQEDCREDDDGPSVVPRSAALVSRTLKGLQAAVAAAPTCSALETSL